MTEEEKLERDIKTCQDAVAYLLTSQDQSAEDRKTWIDWWKNEQGKLIERKQSLAAPQAS